MKIVSALIVLFFLIACGKGDSNPKPAKSISAPSNVSVKDIANNGDATDVAVSFTKPSDLELIEEFRIFFVPTATSDLFDSLAALNATNYAFLPTGTSGNATFASVQTDIDGEVILENEEYNIYVMAIATVESGFGGALSDASSAFTIAQKNVVRTLTVSMNEGSGGMDTDADGNIYMADFGLATNNSNGTNVIKISPSGSITNFANGLTGASGNDFDNDGNLYQSNIGGNAVSKITPSGNVTTFATGFSAPVGIAFDGTSSFYVCNCGDNTIAKVDMEGNVSTFSTSGLFSCPNGIDIDSNGNLYVANFNNPTIVKISPAGVASAFATMPGNNQGHLLVRGDIIYVVSRGSHQIFQVTMSGAVSLLAGNGQRGIIDGPLSEASFSLPNDITFSPDGKYLYVNDVNGTNSNTTIISPTIIRVIELIE